MSLPHIIMWAVVLVVGVPSAWWNPTAGALVLCWVVSEGIFALTGNNLAVAYYIYPDMLVLAVIFAKASRRCVPEAPLGDILYDAWCTDRIVLLIFPFMWVSYVAALHPYYTWWALYYLAIAQFLAAGWEALHPHPCDFAEVGDLKDTRLLCRAARDTP